MACREVGGSPRCSPACRRRTLSWLSAAARSCHGSTRCTAAPLPSRTSPAPSKATAQAFVFELAGFIAWHATAIRIRNARSIGVQRLLYSKCAGIHLCHSRTRSGAGSTSFHSTSSFPRQQLRGPGWSRCRRDSTPAAQQAMPSQTSAADVRCALSARQLLSQADSTGNTGRRQSPVARSLYTPLCKAVPCGTCTQAVLQCTQCAACTTNAKCISGSVIVTMVAL